MKTRFISVLCMLPFIVFVILGGIPLLALCCACSLAAAYEFFKGFEKLGIKASLPVGFALIIALYGIIYGTLVYAKDFSSCESLIGLWLFLAFAFSMLLIIIDKDHNILGPTYTLVGVLYVGFLASFMFFIEQKEHAMAWLPVLIAYLSDIGAYLGGVYFGRHKLAPSISPKKTIEGLIGGIILGTLAAFIFALIAAKENLLAIVILGFIGSFVAEFGDLIASAFKRKMGIKDYSSIIPGHGGILDRIDSILVVLPFVYYYIELFIK